MHISPHLHFDGHCRAAFDYYHGLLGGELRMLSFGDSPLASTIDAQWHERIVHATLACGAFELAGADVLPDDYRKPEGFAVLLTLDSRTEAERVFTGLGLGGEVRLPFQATFWSAGFGVLVDQFGIPWEVGCEQPRSA